MFIYEVKEFLPHSFHISQSTLIKFGKTLSIYYLSLSSTIFVNIITVVLNEGCQKFVRNWKGWRSSNSLNLYLSSSSFTGVTTYCGF